MSTGNDNKSSPNLQVPNALEIIDTSFGGHLVPRTFEGIKAAFIGMSSFLFHPCRTHTSAVTEQPKIPSNPNPTVLIAFFISHCYNIRIT